MGIGNGRMEEVCWKGWILQKCLSDADAGISVEEMEYRPIRLTSHLVS